MSSHGESIELSIKRFQDVVEKIGSEFTKPDDDWMGMVIMESESEMALIPALWRDDDEKWVFTNVLLPDMVDDIDPHTVCHVLSAWMVEMKPGNVTALRPSEHPDRFEVVIIAAITISTYQVWQARIVRFPDKPPKLSPWKMWQDQIHMTGTFFDPIREALEKKAGER